MKIIDRRGEEKEETAPIVIAPQDGEKPKLVNVYAERRKITTTQFEWKCSECQKQHAVIHILQPKETEALASGGEIGHMCPCGVEVKVTESRTQLPGLPNRAMRRAMESKG